MNTKYKKFLSDNFFSIVLSLAVIVVFFLSYNRFIVHYDYIVGYEGICYPIENKCFVGCEDDACTETYYYSKVVKYAPDLYKECGSDITDCDNANSCLPGDRKCSVTYCDPEVDGNICSVYSEEQDKQSDNINTVENEILQTNNLNDTNI